MFRDIKILKKPTDRSYQLNLQSKQLYDAGQKPLRLELHIEFPFEDVAGYLAWREDYRGLVNNRVASKLGKEGFYQEANKLGDALFKSTEVWGAYRMAVQAIYKIREASKVYAGDLEAEAPEESKAALQEATV